MAYLRVISNPSDNLSLERIANVPARALGDTSLLKISTFAADRRISLLDAFRQADQVPELTSRAANAARKLAGLFDSWRNLVAGIPNPPQPGESVPEKSPGAADAENHDDPLFDMHLAEAAAEEVAEVQQQPAATRPSFLLPGGIRGLMERVVKESGIEAEAKKVDSAEDAGIDRLANVNELISVAAEFDVQNPEGSLDDYLQQVTLISDVDKIKDGGGAVTLMTLHAAKGLEFPFVAMVGMEDGLIPHARAIGYSANPDEMEEERRLAFVGITRAMKNLILSNARYRMIRGQTERTIASQFLTEIPEEVFDVMDLTRDEEGAGSVGYRDEA